MNAKPGYSLHELATLLEGALDDSSQGDLRVSTVTSLEVAASNSIAFVESEQYLDRASGSNALAFVTPRGLHIPGRPCVEVRHPRLAFATLLDLFHPRPTPTPGIHPTAVVASTASIHPTASLGPWCVVEDQVEVGANCEIEAHCFLGAGSRLQEGCRLSPKVWIGPQVHLGPSVLLHSRCRVGVEHPSRPLAYDPTKTDSAPSALPRVLLEEGIEVGALTVVAAGYHQPTRIGQSSKIDNLVFVGPEAHLGKACILVSQSMVGAGARLGDHCFVTAQASVDPLAQLASGTIVAARSRVCSERQLNPGVVSGDPARPHKEELRRAATLGRLVDVERRLRRLEEVHGLAPQ